MDQRVEFALKSVSHPRNSAFILYVVFIFFVWRKPNRKMRLRPPGRGERSGVGVIVFISDLLSPNRSQIHPRFCVERDGNRPWFAVL